MRGYFGIGIENCKNDLNIGGLWRSAHCFGASFIFTIGTRYRKQSTDTTKAWKSIPHYTYNSFDHFYKNLPKDCNLIGLEFPHVKSSNIHNFCHPERCIYLLGSEDSGLSNQAIESCNQLLYIPTKYCLNVATTGSIVMFDRNNKND